jgi:hypothetical protein
VQDLPCNTIATASHGFVVQAKATPVFQVECDGRGPTLRFVQELVRLLDTEDVAAADTLKTYIDLSKKSTFDALYSATQT